MPSLLGNAQWYGDYTYAMSGGIIGRTCILSLRIIRTAADWKGAKAWDRAAILTIPPALKPVVNDVNVPGPINGWGFQITSTEIAVRSLQGGNLLKGSWLSACLSWQF